MFTIECETATVLFRLYLVSSSRAQLHSVRSLIKLQNTSKQHFKTTAHIRTRKLSGNAQAYPPAGQNMNKISEDSPQGQEYDSKAPKVTNEITEIPIENITNLYGIKITKETPNEQWDKFPKFEFTIEAHEALKDDALQASMAVTGLLTGLITTRDGYTHSSGSQYEQVPEPRTLEQLRTWNRTGFRLLVLGAVKDLIKRRGFSLSETMIDEAFEEIMSSHAHHQPILRFTRFRLARHQPCNSLEGEAQQSNANS